MKPVRSVNRDPETLIGIDLRTSRMRCQFSDNERHKLVIISYFKSVMGQTALVH